MLKSEIPSITDTEVINKEDVCEEVTIPEVKFVVAEELGVVEGITGIIDVLKSNTILGSNVCDINKVEASEACMSLNNENEVNMELSNINNVCFIFDNVRDLPSNGDKLFVVEKEENDPILHFTNPEKTCFVFDDF